MVVHAELIDFDLLLEPAPLTVHYAEVYVRGPGTLDLSQLTWRVAIKTHQHKANVTAATTKDNPAAKEGDNGGEGDDGAGDDAEGDDTSSTGDDDGGDDDGAEADDDGEANMHDGTTKDKGGGGDTTSSSGDDGGGGSSSTGGGGDDDASIRRQQIRHVQQLPQPAVVVALNPGDAATRALASSSSATTTVIDVVAFHLPSSCSNSRTGCDWTTLGLGAKDESTGDYRWCCTAEAQSLGLCLQGKQNLGRLIIDKRLDRKAVQLQNDGSPAVLPEPQIAAPESGKYVVVMASCSDGGRPVQVTGTASVKSVHGYLPGELYGFLYFYAALTLLYFALVLWYGGMMHLHEESRIPIEKWILTTGVLGLLEMVFKLGNLYIWNEDGYQSQWIALVGILCGVCKSGLSRCLLVMVSLGWGVTRDTLGRKLKWIVVAGMTYIGVAASRDVSLVVAIEDVQQLSQRAETGLFDVYTILTFVEAALDVLFAMWILDSLASTMEYLGGLKQSRKLQRYVRLRCLFLFAILFALLWTAFAVISSVASGIVEEEDAWLVEGSTELNYFMVLVGVACLWRPNPSARDYAYALELSSTAREYDDDDDDGVTELELTGVVPSAMDGDDDDNEYGDNHHHNDDEHFSDAITPPGRNGVRNGGYVD